jgi:hypothetical protein
MPDQDKLKVESLQRQLEILDTLESRHLAWANNTADIQAKRKHFEIADTLRYAREQYGSLLKIYQNPINR